jgi:hypothetical protein
MPRRRSAGSLPENAPSPTIISIHANPQVTPQPPPHPHPLGPLLHPPPARLSFPQIEPAQQRRAPMGQS